MLLTFTSISISLKNIDRTGDMNGWTMTDDRINRGGRRGLRSSDLKGEQKARACLSASHTLPGLFGPCSCTHVDVSSYVTDLVI